MKFLHKMLVVLLSLTMVFGAFAGCGDKVDGGLDDDGNFIPGDSVSEVEFWGWGDAEEIEVFETLVAEFNKANKGIIEVKYVQKAQDGYGDAVATALLSSRPPDVVYAGDGEYKQLAHDGLLTDLTNFISGSKVIKEEEMWESSLNRYRYDVKTTTDKTIEGDPAAVWGLPKDIGPTVIYYNKDHFKAAGVTIISVPESEIATKFGTAIEKDAEGKAVTGKTYSWKGYDADQKVFNNRIAMSWEETVQLSQLIQGQNVADYGYFTEWWFGYGWSVGGDVIQYIPTTDTKYNGGYWDFTHHDETPNFIVDDAFEGEYTFAGKSYKAGEIIDWNDKLVDDTVAAANRQVKQQLFDDVAAGKLDQLPSQREAFTEFARLSQKTNATVDTVDGVALKGYGITPNPTTISTDGKVGYFTSGRMSMLVDGRWSVVNIRKQAKFDWDVAPHPVYKTYNADGTVKAHGIASGHSGSTSVAIASGSSVKNAAWKFIEYIAGPVGQSLQAEAGFAIPNQKAIANSEVFLQTDKKPKNSIVFVEAAEAQTPGDWWYLRNKEWIDEWANVLNGPVRNGEKSLTDFYASSEYSRTYNKLLAYTRKS
jgi:multiple sugar transport system substrate-binding protein